MNDRTWNSFWEKADQLSGYFLKIAFCAVVLWALLHAEKLYQIFKGIPS
jgi:hypothetical protein